MQLRRLQNLIHSIAHMPGKSDEFCGTQEADQCPLTTPPPHLKLDETRKLGTNPRIGGLDALAGWGTRWEQPRWHKAQQQSGPSHDKASWPCWAAKKERIIQESQFSWHWASAESFVWDCRLEFLEITASKYLRSVLFQLLTSQW